MPRPKGLPKTGGRQKGAVDKIKREAILAAQGITPLDYMMTLVRAETKPGLDPAIARARETLRFEAAKAAAPYVHARLPKGHGLSPRLSAGSGPKRERCLGSTFWPD
jgi:hypothetical protein